MHRVGCFAAEHNHCTGCIDYSRRSRIAAQGALIIAWVGYTRIDPDIPGCDGGWLGKGLDYIKN